MEYLQQVLNRLMNADISGVTPEFIVFCGNEALRILNKKERLNEYDIACMELLIQISQILYNNTDRSLLALDDGVYDLLLERDKEYNNKVQVGAPPIEFRSDGEIIANKGDIIKPMIFMDDPEGYMNNELFYEDIGYPTPYYPELSDLDIDRNSGHMVTKKNLSVPHKYPKLVGTLDKCKFTLNKEARDRGVFDDRDVKIFERDFLGKHLQMGLFGPNDIIELDLELKYDGISVEADVSDHIISARSRGDTDADLAADLTPILGGYKFPFCPKVNESFGMKFEAIITHQNLEKLSMLRDKTYKNARNAIIGLFGALDAYDYRDLITLVPLATSIEDMDRATEIEFMNKYYHSGEMLRYKIVRGTYNQVLYMVYKFVKEAEALRPIMPFMYDGVVINYTDPNIIAALGRENSVNKYSMAIKFNPMVRQAIFTGYTFTIGQNGVVTPMLHYTPVEFYGGIHTKSTGHSYARFKQLNLAIGDAVQLEYTNDVMPYLTRCENQPSWGAHNPPVEFPTNCPCCGSPLTFTDKSAICINMDCPERNLSKVTNMMKKLNLKDFSTESLRALNIVSLDELLNITPDRLAVLGDANSQKFMERVNELKTKPIYDYQIVGSLGFSNVAVEGWKKILSKISLESIINSTEEDLIQNLVSIKGIGMNTAQTIVAELPYFFKDLLAIKDMPNVVRTIGMTSNKSIRFTGVRDQELCNYLNSIGYDANGNAGVTRQTDILIVPYDGYTSTKTSKVGPNTIIVGIDSFKANMDKYLL